MSLKQSLSKVLPRRVRYYLKALKIYSYDIRRFVDHSNAFYGLNNSNKIIGQIVLKYHVLEKGLTMPNMKVGFGFDLVLSLTSLCNLYLKRNFNPRDKHFIHAIQVLHEYLIIHENLNHMLNDKILIEIHQLLKTASISASSPQLQFSNNEYFKYSKGTFKEFAFSRHSVRNFTDKDVEIDLLKEAISIAQKSPSSCNRQPNRAYIIQNKEHIKWILDKQKGNRGFGQLINKVIVLSSELGVFDISEKNEAHLNSGMFAMSLLYGLHYSKIGALPLAYICFSEDDDKELRTLCRIPDSEIVTLIIGCGYPPDKLSVASSPRYNTEEIVTII